MTYHELVKHIHKMTGIHMYLVKDVIDNIPGILRDELKVGDSIRTPLGVFTKKHYREKHIKTPRGRPSVIVERAVARLKEGSKMMTMPTNLKWDYVMKKGQFADPEPLEEPVAKEPTTTKPVVEKQAAKEPVEESFEEANESDGDYEEYEV